MNQALPQIRQVESAIILRRFSQGLSERVSDSLELVAAVIDTVENRGVRDIVFCGHSMCSGLPAGEHELPRRSGWHGLECLLQGIRHREAMNELGKERVLQQVTLWENIPSMARAIAFGELQIHGLFYLAESGLFTRYEEVTRQFVAILDSTWRRDASQSSREF